MAISHWRCLPADRGEKTKGSRSSSPSIASQLFSQVSGKSSNISLFDHFKAVVFKTFSLLSLCSSEASAAVMALPVQKVDLTLLKPLWQLYTDMSRDLGIKGTSNFYLTSLCTNQLGSSYFTLMCDDC